MRFSLKRLLILVAVLSVILAGVAVLRNVQNTILDAYRVWDTARALESYMDAHEGAWPKNWDELIRFAEESGIYWLDGSIATLRDDVAIDFEFDPVAATARIREDDVEPDFKVVWLRNGSGAYWEGAEPNKLIFDYLKSNKFGGSASVASSGVRQAP